MATKVRWDKEKIRETSRSGTQDLPHIAQMIKQSTIRTYNGRLVFKDSLNIKTGAQDSRAFAYSN